MSQPEQTSAARLGIEKSQLELTQYLRAEDPLPMAIRAHIHIEDELLNFIKVRGNPKNQIPSKYAHRVQLALKLGFQMSSRSSSFSLESFATASLIARTQK
jgi:hypothetical protein